MWGATLVGSNIAHHQFISIHAPRVGCDQTRTDLTRTSRISIHAPRVGCDDNLVVECSPKWHFNPRTPCGVRQLYTGRKRESIKFQSTHPVWGATPAICFFPSGMEFQSTHPVWGATPMLTTPISPPLYFNPRTPCGVRPQLSIRALPDKIFQSTHPVWGATEHAGQRNQGQPISIHAPRVGCDTWSCILGTAQENFNPRTPCGVRRTDDGIFQFVWRFQSTHPVWGATREPSALSFR